MRIFLTLALVTTIACGENGSAAAPSTSPPPGAAPRASAPAANRPAANRPAAAPLPKIDPLTDVLFVKLADLGAPVKVRTPRGKPVELPAFTVGALIDFGQRPAGCDDSVDSSCARLPDGRVVLFEHGRDAYEAVFTSPTRRFAAIYDGGSWGAGQLHVLSRASARRISRGLASRWSPVADAPATEDKREVCTYQAADPRPVCYADMGWAAFAPDGTLYARDWTRGDGHRLADGKAHRVFQVPDKLAAQFRDLRDQGGSWEPTTFTRKGAPIFSRGISLPETAAALVD